MSTFIANLQQQADLREGASILRRVQKELKEMIAPGVTGIQMDQHAEALIRSMGATPSFKGYGGFSATLCVMTNEQIVHGVPSAVPLANGDLLSVDCGVYFKGLHTDAAFSLVVGGASANPAREQFQQCVWDALQAGCGQAVAGNHVGAIGHAIEQVIRAGGYKLCKEYTGHGLGPELHQDPHIYNYGSPRDGMVLREGMVIAIEPIVAAGRPRNKTLADQWTVVTLDGKDACQWEHCGIVQSDHFEVLV